MPTVLIAEDDPRISHLLVYEFESRGWQTVPCPTGDTAAAALRVAPVDVIVTDSGLHLSGRGPLLEHLRGGPQPVVVYSAMPPDEGQLLVVRRMADAFVPKPAPVARVIETVESLLGLGTDPDSPDCTDVMVLSPEFERWVAELTFGGWTVEGVRTVVAAVRRMERRRIRAIAIDTAIAQPPADQLARTARRLARESGFVIIALGTAEAGPNFDVAVAADAPRGTLARLVADLLKAPDL